MQPQDQTSKISFNKLPAARFQNFKQNGHRVSLDLADADRGTFCRRCDKRSRGRAVPGHPTAQAGASTEGGHAGTHSTRPNPRSTSHPRPCSPQTAGVRLHRSLGRCTELVAVDEHGDDGGRSPNLNGGAAVDEQGPKQRQRVAAAGADALQESRDARHGILQRADWERDGSRAEQDFWVCGDVLVHVNSTYKQTNRQTHKRTNEHTIPTNLNSKRNLRTRMHRCQSRKTRSPGWPRRHRGPGPRRRPA